MIRILTDSSADFSRRELEERGIDLVALNISFDSESLSDDDSLSSEVFWNRMIAGENPKTSQPSPDAFLSHFARAKEAGDEVVCVLLSSALSGTVQSAMIARGMMDDAPVYIVDSLQATAALKLLVLRACQLRDEGLSAGDIARELEHFKTRIRLYACLNTLEYLARGGRIPKAAASLGTLVQLKPIVTIDADGRVGLAGKGMGLHRATEALIRMACAHVVDTRFPVLPLYTHTTDNCAALVRKLTQAGFPCRMEDAHSVGPTISTHIGPGAFGVVYVEAE